MARIRSRQLPVVVPDEVRHLEPRRAPANQQGLGRFADAYPAAETPNVALRNRLRREKDDWLWAYGEDV